MADAPKVWRKFVKQGFEKIDADMDFLVGCLRDVFVEMGEADLINVLPGSVAHEPGKSLPDRGAQAISIAFQLLNLVEENAAQQTMRARENASGVCTEAGLWARYLEDLKRHGIPAKKILHRIASQKIEPVLTGHPTEAKRWTVLDQHRQLYVLLVQLENQMYTPAERDGIREEIKTVLEQLWRTGEILLTKPDVRSERLNALYYFREKFPQVLESLDRRFEQAWQEAGYGAEKTLTVEDYPRLRFGSWVGGDRDGHPLVTAEITAETLDELRTNAIQLIDSELAKLEKNLGLSIYAQEIPDLLTDGIRNLAKRMGARSQTLLQQNHEEPWRQYIALLRASLPPAGPAPARGTCTFPSELRRDLQLLSESLEQIQSPRLKRHALAPVIRMLDTFGFHLARLDIRQNSSWHDQAIGQLMSSAGLDPKEFVGAPEDQRLAFLERELATLRPFARHDMPLGNEARNVLDTYAVVRRHMLRYGRAGIGALIISMTRSLSDLLAVYLLAREAGLLRQGPEGTICMLPVVPLFETIDDLQNSPAIVDAFLRHPITRRSLPFLRSRYDEKIARHDTALKEPNRRENPVQQIMLGYSDSNKDSGILASQWALQTAQRKLIHIAHRQKITLCFFHGRGGTVSRGAGPTHRFLEALPAGSLTGGFRVTEQGETISQKYTNRRTAAYHLELLMAGATGVSLNPARPPHPEAMETTMAFLAESSRAKYRQLLQDPDFIEYYRQATPIDALEVSRIGSRPSRRSGKMTLDDLRAIPWVFSWTQARFYLPGWYGVGSALEELLQQQPKEFAILEKQYAEWPFLRYVLFNIETGLASASESLIHSYSGLVENAEIRNRLCTEIVSELQLTRKNINRILGGELEVRRPRFVKTLRARDEGLNILHHEQIRLLRQWRSASRKDAETVLPNLLLTINAIASGLRTTG